MKLYYFAIVEAQTARQDSFVHSIHMSELDVAYPSSSSKAASSIMPFVSDARRQATRLSPWPVRAGVAVRDGVRVGDDDLLALIEQVAVGIVRARTCTGTVRTRSRSQSHCRSRWQRCVSSGAKLPSPTNVIWRWCRPPPTSSYDRTAGKDGARQRGIMYWPSCLAGWRRVGPSGGGGVDCGVGRRCCGLSR